MTVWTEERRLPKWAVALPIIYNLLPEHRYASKIQRALDASPSYANELLRILVRREYLTPRKANGRIYYNFTVNGDKAVLCILKLCETLPRAEHISEQATFAQHL